jgi:acyl carrier protein phosphodiesterase
MNYLAHIYLSGECLDTQLGGLLGDFVKGRLPVEWLGREAEPLLLDAQYQAQKQAQVSPPSGVFPSSLPSSSILLDAQGQPWSRELLAGVQLHRSIDAYIDGQPAFKRCIECLGPEHRRIAGIALDVFFDHLLAARWHDFHARPLSVFCDNFYRHCAEYQPRLPERAGQLMVRAKTHRLFESYANLSVIELVLERIGRRLSRKTSLDQVMPVLIEQQNFLVVQFEQLMPQLQDFAATRRRQLDL